MEKHFVRIIDANGIFQGDDAVDELTEFTIEASIPNGMYAVPGLTPKWERENVAWKEVVSAPAPPPTTPEPTTEERVSALETLYLQAEGII